MSCRNCGSDRIAFIQAHSKDLSIFQCEHLSIDSDGYFPDIPGVCCGDDADFEFCLECGMIQSDTFPITDETVKAAVAPDEDDEDDEDDDEDMFSRPPLIFHRIDDNSKTECIVKDRVAFYQLPWVVTMRATSGFYNWAISTDPNGDRLLLATFFVDDIVFKKVALIPDRFHGHRIIGWDEVSEYLIEN